MDSDVQQEEPTEYASSFAHLMGVRLHSIMQILIRNHLDDGHMQCLFFTRIPIFDAVSKSYSQSSAVD